MAKKITQSQIVGERGIALVHQRVSEMGFLWYPSGATEAGIDGSIEIRDGRTGVVTNQVVQVQSKATAGAFASESEEAFEYVCRENDLAYWLGGNAPVILVRSRPETDEAYWVSLKDYFSDPQRLSSRKIVFDKRRDSFDKAAAASLIKVAVPREAGVYIAPPPRRERLVMNLLGVRQFPENVYVADTEFRRPRDLAAALRLVNGGGREWFLRSGRVCSVDDLREPPWPELCDRGSVEEFSADEWATSDDPVQQREFAELLYACLAAKTGRELKHVRMRGENCYFARPGHDLDVRRLPAVGSRRKGRIIFRSYESKKHEGQVGFCKHWGFRAQFQRLGDRWFLAINPDYRFTIDGYRESLYAADYTSNAKRLEFNDAVRQQVQAWAKFLTSSGTLFVANYPHLVFDDLVSFELPVGVDEASWSTKDRRTANRDAGVDSLFAE